jgi:hypothetical protein
MMGVERATPFEPKSKKKHVFLRTLSTFFPLELIFYKGMLHILLKIKSAFWLERQWTRLVEVPGWKDAPTCWIDLYLDDSNKNSADAKEHQPCEKSNIKCIPILI